MIFKKVIYQELNDRQKENYNYSKISGILADYGYTTFRLSDDWGGADFIAVHVEGHSIRVQLKSRLSFAKKYQGKDLYVGFLHEQGCYLFPHDEILARVLEDSNIENTRSWRISGGWNYPRLTPKLKKILEAYKLGFSS